MNISITWYGHACFKAEYNHSSVVFDPYQDESVPGLSLPKDITADAVYCSHAHADHNAAELIHLTGNKEPFSTWKVRVPHDDAEGAKRGMCDMCFVRLGSCVLAHLGDIGRLPTASEYEELKKADILLIPAGGYFTIDAKQAEMIIEEARPYLAILMHYRNGWGYDVTADITDIRKVFPQLKELPENTITFDEHEIPNSIITMVPKQ